MVENPYQPTKDANPQQPGKASDKATFRQLGCLILSVLVLPIAWMCLQVEASVHSPTSRPQADDNVLFNVVFVATAVAFAFGAVTFAIGIFCREAPRISMAGAITVAIVGVFVLMNGWAGMLWSQPRVPAYSWLALSGIGMTAGGLFAARRIHRPPNK